MFANIVDVYAEYQSPVSSTPTQANADLGRELAGQRFRDFCTPVVGRVCFSVGNFPAVHTQYVSHFGGDSWLKVPTLLLKPTELPVFAVVGAGEAAADEAFVVKV